MLRVTAKTGTRRCKIGILDPYFHAILGKVQERYPETIPPNVEVMTEFSLRRSLRRGATSQARNQKVPEAVINANNRWRAWEKAKGSAPGGSMLETYTDARANLPARLEFSFAL
jgi:hypothetical protein